MFPNEKYVDTMELLNKLFHPYQKIFQQHGQPIYEPAL